jgi:hypothetical protein
MNQRCSVTDTDAGRCELRAGHYSAHLVTADECYLSWFADELYVYSRHRPPGWIYELEWAAS